VNRQTPSQGEKLPCKKMYAFCFYVVLQAAPQNVRQEPLCQEQIPASKEGTQIKREIVIVEQRHERVASSHCQIEQNDGTKGRFVGSSHSAVNGRYFWIGVPSTKRGLPNFELYPIGRILKRVKLSNLRATDMVLECCKFVAETACGKLIRK
jgi:hypothetical protein